MKGWLRILLAAVSGVALALCFVPFDQNWLVWGWLWILLPLFWTTDEKRRGLRGFGLGWVAGMGFWVVNLKWLGTVTWPGAVVLSAYLSLYFGLFGAFASKFVHPWREPYQPVTGISSRLRESGRSLGRAALLGGLWCGLEWFRGWFLTGFGWNGLGVTFARSLVLAQNAEYVGVIGLSFLPVFMSAVVVQTGRRFYQQVRAGEVKILHWDFASALLAIMVAFTAGTIRLSSATNQPKIEGRVLLVQQDIPQVAGEVLWEPEEVLAGFESLTDSGLEEAEEQMARSLVEAGEKAAGEEVFAEIRPPDLVVWPEACLPSQHYSLWIMEEGSSLGGPLMEDLIRDIAGKGDFHFIYGTNEVREESAGDLTVFNSLVIDRAGKERKTSRKRHLVILGEYIPDLPFFREFYKMTTGVDFLSNMTPGEEYEPLEIEMGGQTIGVMPSICFEDTLGRVMRRFVRAEPQMIVNITNDGWFQESEGSAQHFRNGLFRCIELRRPMVRCANRGVTGVVSVTGSLVDPFTGAKRSLEDENGSHFHRGFLLASVYVPTEGEVTLFAIFGNWFAATGLAAGILWTLYMAIRSRRKRGRS